MIKFCNEAADVYLKNCVGEVFTSVIEWHKYLICFQEKLFFLPPDVFCQVVGKYEWRLIGPGKGGDALMGVCTLGSSSLLTCQF